MHQHAYAIIDYVIRLSSVPEICPQLHNNLSFFLSIFSLLIIFILLPQRTLKFLQHVNGMSSFVETCQAAFTRINAVIPTWTVLMARMRRSVVSDVLRRVLISGKGNHGNR